MKKQDILNEIKKIIFMESNLGEEITFINDIKKAIGEVCSIKEPVNFVKFVKSEKIEANSYNPNKVAPPEMKLLKESIKIDGYTQPIVCFKDEKRDKYIVIDGFHRLRVGKEVKEIKEKLSGYLPIVVIKKNLSERMESTIRHNRARGKHAVVLMQNIVIDLIKDGYDDEKICKKLGMCLDELLRFKQVSGLPDVFKDRSFSKGWE